LKVKRVMQELQKESLLTVIVAGVSSGAGKTSVAEAVTGVLARERRTAAAKITVTHGERGCPHGGKGCNVCSSLGGDFQLITRDSIIQQPGTDTARLSAAGATPVVWAITRDITIKEAWHAMSGLLSSADCAVIESNTLTEHIRPALTLMIADPIVSRRLWKPSAERLLATADFLIFNDRGTPEQKARLLTEIEHVRKSVADLIYVSHPNEVASHPALLASLSNICSSFDKR
jgi:hypothetical protein